jgi:hypothetical protein
LSFVEDDYVIHWGPAVAQPCVAEVVYVLDERLDLLLYYPFSGVVIPPAEAIELVAGMASGPPYSVAPQWSPRFCAQFE